LHKYFLVFLLLVVIISCSKEENPTSGTPDDLATGIIITKVNNDNWSADEIRASKKTSNTNITAIKYVEESLQYPSSEIIITLKNLSQPGSFGIGEDEPGYQYFVKANYILRSQSGTEDKVYTAYYRNISVMNITQISDSRVEANFIFKGYLDDFSDSIVVSEGVIKINF
jgi:hypothetical protein